MDSVGKADLNKGHSVPTLLCLMQIDLTCNVAVAPYQCTALQALS